MIFLFLTPFLLQALAIALDEFYFHQRREIPNWERWGHPFDTGFTLGCYVLIWALPPMASSLWIYVIFATISSLFVLKDEWVHARLCSGGELALHALLFSLHPLTLFLLGLARFSSLQIFSPSSNGSVNVSRIDSLNFFFNQTIDSHFSFHNFLLFQIILLGVFLIYQIFYWNGPWKKIP